MSDSPTVSPLCRCGCGRPEGEREEQLRDPEHCELFRQHGKWCWVHRSHGETPRG